MDIDARTMHHADFRSFTVRGAVAVALDAMGVGESLVVLSLRDAVGRERPMSTLSTNVGMLKNGRKFSVLKSEGALATIHRIA